MLAAATRRITSLIWWFGIIITGLIGLTATLELVGRAAAAVFGDPNLPGMRWLALDALLAAAAVGGLAAIVTIARHGREWSAYALGLALTVLTRGIQVSLR